LYIPLRTKGQFNRKEKRLKIDFGKPMTGKREGRGGTRGEVSKKGHVWSREKGEMEGDVENIKRSIIRFQSG